MTLALLPGLWQLENDNSPSVFFVLGSPAVERYATFQQLFGSDDVVRLSARGDGLWSPESLRWLSRLETLAAQGPGVEEVVGPLTRPRGTGQAIFVVPEDASDVEVLDVEVLDVGVSDGTASDGKVSDRDGVDLESLPQRLLQSPLDRHLGLISSAGDGLTILVRLTSAVEGDEGEAQQRRALAHLSSLLRNPPNGLETSLVGLPVLNRALDDSAQEIERIYFPALIIFAVFLLWLIFRDWRGIVLPLAFVGISLLLALGTMGYAGIRLNLILAILPPLLFVIALAHSLHLLLRFRQLRATSGHRKGFAAVLRTFADKGWAVWWAGVTTFLGFASFAFSPVAPVRSLGRWAAFGIVAITVVSFTFYPLLLASGNGKPTPPRELEVWSRRWGRRWGKAAYSGRRWILIVATVLVLIAGWGLTRIEVESNALRYLPAQDPVRKEIEALDRLAIGSATVEVLLRGTGSPAFDEPAQLLKMAELGDEMIQQPLVFGAVSAGTLYADTLQSVPRPPGVAESIRQQWVLQGLLAQPAGRRVFERLLHGETNTARLTLFVATEGHRPLAPALENVRQTLESALPGVDVAFTGQYLLLLEMQNHLLSILAISLCFTLLAVAIIFFWLLPGYRLPFLALLPNIWPVLGILGFMGWAGVPLDISTVMVASVVLGLAVDDTLHTLGHFRHLAPRLGVRQAVIETMQVTTSAYLMTGLILMAGFGVCSLSRFAPTARFGGLSALAIGLAVLGDLFLLPALLSASPCPQEGKTSEPPLPGEEPTA